MNTDEELMRELGRVLDAADNSQIPGMEAAKAALAWRNLDTELAQLVFDSRAEVLESEVVMRGHDLPSQPQSNYTRVETSRLRLRPTSSEYSLFPTSTLGPRP